MGDSHVGRKRSSDEDDPAGKRQKNRDAARKCREKKVQETQNLKKKNDDLVKTNRELSRKKSELEMKLDECVKEIKKHRDSGCSLPPNVAAIIESAECPQANFFQDFIPVGTQELNHQHKTELHHADLYEEAVSSPEESRPMVQGLFSGSQLPVARRLSRNSSSASRSPSRSPPPPSPKSQIPTLLSKRGIVLSKPQNHQPSWDQLHQQTVGEQISPRLSPAQTVPNIDSEMYVAPETYHHKYNGFPDITMAVQHARKGPAVTSHKFNEDPAVTSHKYSGFPDINTAVQHAQRDVGVTEDVQHPTRLTQVSDIMHAPPEKDSTPSIGFTPNVRTPTSPRSAQSMYGFDQSSSGNLGNVPNFVPAVKCSESLKPISSGSITVSMKNTAELFSQAMTAFEPAEISDDLKRQFVRVSSNEETQHNHHNRAHGTSGIPRQQQLCNEKHAEIACDDGDLDTFYEELIRVAREQGQDTITVQFRDKDYTCNYEQLKQVILAMKQQQNSATGNSVTLPYISESSAPMVETGHVQQIPLSSTYLYNSGLRQVQEAGIANQNVGYYMIQNDQKFPLDAYHHQIAMSVPMAQQVVEIPFETEPVPQQVVEIPFQSNQLPTTVVSMIQEESSVNPATSNEVSLDSVDYSKNVQDLPSLSLTEDDTNIFDKRRRL